MTKLSDLEKGIPALKLEHYGAFSPDAPEYFKGETMQISCKAERAQSEVLDFAENHSNGQRDWIFKIGYPKYIDNRFVWVLMR